MKKQIAGILALAMSLSMASCSSDSGSGEAPANETTTTAAAVKDETTAKADNDTDASADEEQETTAETVEEPESNYFEEALAKLPDVELKRKYQEVKVISWYEPPELAVELFEQKYGGTVSVYLSAYDEQMSDLGRYIGFGEGLDLYMTSGYDDFPRLFVSNGIIPFDGYIDLDSDIWQDTKDCMELFNFGEKHFNIVTDVSASYACYYNKKTIEEYGFDDPWELYKAGNWNWDTMKSMLSKFADEEDLRYGLDGYYQTALYMSTGVPMIGLSDGKLVGNGADKSFLNALDFGRELFNSGLLYPDTYNAKPELLGEGDLLFYIGGTGEINSASTKWSISSDDIGVVPVPSPAGSDPYQSVSITGCAFVKDSENPEGAALFAQCLALAANYPGNKQKQKDEYGLSDQIISQLDEINELARQYPTIECIFGCSGDGFSGYNYRGVVSDVFSGKDLKSGFDRELSSNAEYANSNIQKAIG